MGTVWALWDDSDSLSSSTLLGLYKSAKRARRAAKKQYGLSAERRTIEEWSVE